MMTYIFLGLLTVVSLTILLIYAVRQTDMEEFAVSQPREDKQPTE